MWSTSCQGRVDSPGGHEYFLLTEEPFSRDTLISTVLAEPVGLDDGTRLICIFNGCEVCQPGLLAHRIDVDLRGAQTLEKLQSLVAVGAVESSGLIHLPRHRLG